MDRDERDLDRDGEANEPAIFDAVLAPNRSLGRAGFFAVMACVVVVTCGLGTYFMLQGAWPVFGFFGLDVALLYFAFRLNYRAGRLRETIRVTHTEVVVQRIAPSGRGCEWQFNPFWLRVVLSDPGEHHSRITLSSHGQSLELGSFLAPDDRESLVDALRDALGEANRAPSSDATEPEHAEAGTMAGPLGR